MKTSKILLVIGFAVISTFSLTAAANVTWEQFEERNAVLQKDHIGGSLTSTILYFDTGRVCENRYRSGTDCSNWDVNPMQANFFVETCRKHSKDKDICDWYWVNQPKLQ